MNPNRKFWNANHQKLNRTIARLLLMPPTGHCILHLNEALKIRKKILMDVSYRGRST